jgi:GcrA cell cycle regulator
MIASPNVVSIPDVKGRIPAPPGFWTEERVRELHKCLSVDVERLSASKIASSLGCTKNTVIGRCYREGVALPLARCSSVPKHITPNPFPERGCCLYGYGNPGEPGFHFCGKPNLPGKCYCAEHCAQAYVKPDPDRMAAL